ncbi:hypothetical protein AXE65_07365 [Ventosimonas gracilis]|uniref:CheW-like domain-containing protein n=1 Tax=Ventosimonas gracilis TaxID=1680762 RepID=A0A139SI42_9GAMM|nr:chemotaxis protein CheW [Ventosimonas gracilis]KXU34217.1 hypothetical protein AXE65_07365 [Ventosimonas gracilis]
MKPVHTTHLNALLLPLAGRTLMLPSAAVAEVIRYPDQPAPVGNAQGWLLGNIDWRGLSLPLLSFEALAGRSLPPPSGRIAVLNLTDERARIKFCALLLQGFPRPLQADEQLPRNNDEPLAALELCAVSLADGKTAIIPNMPALEQQLLAAGVL